MSVTDCGNHVDCEQRKLYRRIAIGVLIFISFVLFIVFTVWLAFHPSKPKFYIQEASIYQINLTAGTGLLTTVMQVTVSSRNPNDRIGIYYDKLDAFAVYKGQQITASTELPTGYQGHNDVVVWSPYLYGTAVPVAPYLSACFEHDDTAGLIRVNVKVDGRLRWKVGTWISGHYHLQANCPAFLSIDHGKTYGDKSSFHFQQMSACSVDV